MGKLGIGTKLITRFGPDVTIRTLVYHHYTNGIEVFNFEVRGDHSYFVGDLDGGVWVHNVSISLDEAPSDAQKIVDSFKVGRTTRPIYNQTSGALKGEITNDGGPKVVIRRPHTDQGTPVEHWNVEDSATGTNWHIRIIR